MVESWVTQPSTVLRCIPGRLFPATLEIASQYPRIGPISMIATATAIMAIVILVVQILVHMYILYVPRPSMCSLSAEEPRGLPQTTD